MKIKYNREVERMDDGKLDFWFATPKIQQTDGEFIDPIIPGIANELFIVPNVVIDCSAFGVPVMDDLISIEKFENGKWIKEFENGKWIKEFENGKWIKK